MRHYESTRESLCQCVLAALVACTALLSHGAAAQNRIFTWGYNTWTPSGFPAPPPISQLGTLPIIWSGSNLYGRGIPARIRAFSTVPTPNVGSGNVGAIATGISHTLALKTDGTVWAWGDNTYGQLGNSHYASSDRPVQVVFPTGVALTDVIAIAAGGNHSIALKGDGSVWTWGDNTDGQLGNGTHDSSFSSTPHPTPYQVTSLNTKVKAIAAGINHNMVLDDSGTVWLWGDDRYGQLGDNGTAAEQDSPVLIKQVSNGLHIAAGGNNSMAQTQDGSVWVWGGVNTKVPARVPGLTGTITAISTNDAGTFGLKNDGTLWNITNSGGLQANQVPGISNVATVSSGYVHFYGGTSTQYEYGSTTVALNNGTVWSVGGNNYGQLGDGTTNNVHQWNWVQAVGIGNAVQVQPGGGHTVALGSDGKIWIWGDNTVGQLAAVSPLYESWPTRTRLTLGSVSTAAVGNDSSGHAFFLTVRRNGEVWGWGSNTNGQLGDGTTNDSDTTPVQTYQFSNVVQVAANRNASSYAIKADGTLWAWGYNGTGQLGDNTTIDHHFARQVAGLTGVTAISPGTNHAIALKSDGTVWAWGDNSYGQIGDGTTTQRLTPVQVSKLTNVSAVAAGDAFNLALKSDGTVWAWGYNGYGQLGNGNTTQQKSPVQVSGLTNIVAIAAGFGHSLALDKNGAVWAWGTNYEGELGNGTTSGSNTPQRVSGLTQVVQISAGGTGVNGWGGNGLGGQSFAIKSDRTVWAWGYDNYGQLGDGITTSGGNQLTPVQVILPGVTRILSGGNVTLGLVKDIEPDYDADGNPDLFLQNNITGQHQVWYMDGSNYNGSNAALGGANVPTSWTFSGTADFVGKGTPDLIWQNNNGAAVYEVLNGVTPISVSSITHSFPAQWKIVGTPDLNGDGIPDMVWQNTLTGGVNYILLNYTPLNGITTVSAGVIVHTMPLEWKVVGTADMDGDGYADLIWQDTLTGDVMVWYMNNTTYTGNWDILETGIPLNQHLVSIQDLDGDNQPDLIWQTDAGDAIFWQMDEVVGWTGTWNYISQSFPVNWTIMRAH